MTLKSSILNHQKDYIIIYSPWCGYSMNALNLLRSSNAKYKRITFENCGGKDKVIKILSSIPSLKYDTKHLTRPIIIKDGLFLGGYKELQNILK